MVTVIRKYGRIGTYVRTVTMHTYRCLLRLIDKVIIIVTIHSHGAAKRGSVKKKKRRSSNPSSLGLAWLYLAWRYGTVVCTRGSVLVLVRTRPLIWSSMVLVLVLTFDRLVFRFWVQFACALKMRLILTKSERIMDAQSRLHSNGHAMNCTCQCALPSLPSSQSM